MAGEGAKVAFTDITHDAGAALEEQLRGSGADAMFLDADATDEENVAATVRHVVDRWDGLDVAVNNVGNIGPTDVVGGLIHETELAAWRGTLAVSLESTFLGMKHEIAQMLDQGGGVIANTSALAGIRVALKGTPAYTAAKAGVIHLTRLAAVMYAKHNIRVNTVAPGATATPAMKAQFTPAELDAMASEFQPMGRMVEPEELANAFLWVCSDDASGVTGHVIAVDGGWTAT